MKPPRFTPFVIQLTEEQASDLRLVAAICLVTPEELIVAGAMFSVYGFFEGNSELQDDIEVRQDEVERFVTDRVSPLDEVQRTRVRTYNDRVGFCRQFAERTHLAHAI